MENKNIKTGQIEFEGKENTEESLTALFTASTSLNQRQEKKQQQKRSDWSFAKSLTKWIFHLELSSTRT